MKNFLILGAILGSIGLFGCGGSSSSNGGGGHQQPPTNTSNGNGYAATPQPCNTQNQFNTPIGVNCQNYNNWYSGWNPNQIQWNYGPWYWPYQYQITGSNCGCPTGYYPVFGQTFGMACAPVTYFKNYVVYYNYGWGGFSYWNYPQNTGWINVPQVSYQGAPSGTCSQTTAQGCDVRLNTCPSGSTCQPVGGGSTIGLCVK